MTDPKRVKQGDKLSLEVEALRGEVEGEITRTGSSFAITIPVELMEHKGGFVNRAGVFAKIPIIDRETGRRGFIAWYRLPDSMTKDRRKE